MSWAARGRSPLKYHSNRGPGSSCRSAMNPSSETTLFITTVLTACLRRGAPRGVATDEAHQPVDDGRVVRHGDRGAVLPGVAQQLLDRAHPLQQLGGEVLVEPGVLAAGAGEVPGVHEDVGGVELVDRVGEAVGAGAGVGEGLVAALLDQRLHGVRVVLPRGDRVVGHRRAGRQLDAAAGQEAGEPRRRGGRRRRARSTRRRGPGADQSGVCATSRPKPPATAAWRSAGASGSAIRARPRRGGGRWRRSRR